MRLAHCTKNRLLWAVEDFTDRIMNGNAPPARRVRVLGLHTFPSGHQDVTCMMFREDGSDMHTHLYEAKHLYVSKKAAWLNAAKRLEESLEPEKKYAEAVRKCVDKLRGQAEKMKEKD